MASTGWMFVIVVAVIAVAFPLYTNGIYSTVEQARARLMDMQAQLQHDLPADERRLSRTFGNTKEDVNMNDDNDKYRPKTHPVETIYTSYVVDESDIPSRTMDLNPIWKKIDQPIINQDRKGYLFSRQGSNNDDMVPSSLKQNMPSYEKKGNDYLGHDISGNNMASYEKKETDYDGHDISGNNMAINEQDSSSIILKDLSHHSKNTLNNDESFHMGVGGLPSQQSMGVKKLQTPKDKISAVRQKLIQRLMKESRNPSTNQSIITIAFLSFGILVFDVLGDAMFGGSSNVLGAFSTITGFTGLGFGDPVQRETVLPGYGIFGDRFNNMAEIALNMITIYLYKDESPDCGERMLCESNQQAQGRGVVDSLLTYVSGFAVSFFLNQAPVSRNLEAMRAGRHGRNCEDTYPRCAISL